MANINSTNKKCRWGCGEKGNLIYFDGIETITITMKISLENSQKLKINLSFNSVIEILAIYPKDSYPTPYILAC